jgi:nitrile hydratase
MTEQFSYPSDREEASAAQVRALEALLIEKGVIAGTTVDKVLGYFESEMTPLNGKKIVARAWVDPEFARLLASDTPAAIAQLELPEGMAGAEGEHIAAVVNEPGVSARCVPASLGRSSVCRRTGTRTLFSVRAPLANRV